MDKENAIKISLAAVGGWVSDWMGTAAPMLILVIIAVLLDYTTGMFSAYYNEGFSSSKGRRGIVRKVSFIFMLGLGFFLDAAIPYFVKQGLDITLPISLPFGLIIGAWIIITEAISVLENLCKIDGVPIPGFLTGILKSMKDKID